MTGKPAMTDDEGPGMRADRARKRRMALFIMAYAVVAIGFMVGMGFAAHRPTAGPVTFPPGVAVAAAVLFPLLFGGAIWIFWRMHDEVARRVVLVAWAGGFIAFVFGTASWGFLYKGGLAPEPNAIVLLMGSAIVVMIVAWVRQRL
jgi:uncharacterized BrkB/YihY/UPF0761 family membrane protein